MNVGSCWTFRKWIGSSRQKQCLTTQKEQDDLCNVLQEPQHFPKHSQAASAPGAWCPEHRDEEMPHWPSLAFTTEPAGAGGTGSRVTPDDAAHPWIRMQLFRPKHYHFLTPLSSLPGQEWIKNTQAQSWDKPSRVSQTRFRVTPSNPPANSAQPRSTFQSKTVVHKLNLHQTLKQLRPQLSCL